MSLPTEDDAVRAFLPQLGAHTLQGYWAVLPYNGGLIRTKSSAGAEAFVGEVFRLYAVDLCHTLNREIRFGGWWAVCWSEFDLAAGFPRHLAMIWFDRDGDVQFVVDSEDDLASAVYGMDDYVQQCSEAHAAWKGMLGDVGVRADQRKAFGRGEASADPKAMPDVVPFN